MARVSPVSRSSKRDPKMEQKYIDEINQRRSETYERNKGSKTGHRPMTPDELNGTTPEYKKTKLEANKRKYV